MNKFFRKIKNIFYSLPFGLRAADSEIMGSNVSGDGNDTTINQQVNDKRVAKHLLKGEITQEVEELRYRTYKVNRESDKYDYVGNGIAIKKEEEKPNKTNIIKFTQENKLICSDILTELKRVGGYGVERYTVEIDYSLPVRFKLQEFLTNVDVVIKDNESPVTTLRFSDVRNPSMINSKPFVTELERLETLFNNNDTYGLSRNDFATAIIGMNFVTYHASDDEPDVISYRFNYPELIGVHHENGEFKLLYQWKEFKREDLTDKFFNKELEEKYKNKIAKSIKTETEITDVKEIIDEQRNKTIKCSGCGKGIKTFSEGYIIHPETGEPLCLECYKNYLLNLNNL